MNLPPQQAEELLNLARAAIRAAIEVPQECGVVEAPAHPALLQPAGCFVSLHEIATKRLRGCVGRLDAREPVYLAVADSARAALADPRFEDERLTLADLPNIELEVSLLSPLADAAGPLAFDPVAQGIVLTIGDRSGCFLPQVARETGWTREQLLERLCLEKLDLRADAWTDPMAKLQTFTALILGPARF